MTENIIVIKKNLVVHLPCKKLLISLIFQYMDEILSMIQRITFIIYIKYIKDTSFTIFRF